MRGIGVVSAFRSKQRRIWVADATQMGLHLQATVPNEPISRSSGRLTRVTSRAHSQTRLECAVLHVGMLSALRA